MYKFGIRWKRNAQKQRDFLQLLDQLLKRGKKIKQSKIET